MADAKKVLEGEIPEGFDNAVVEDGKVITKQRSENPGPSSWEKESE